MRLRSLAIVLAPLCVLLMIAPAASAASPAPLLQLRVELVGRVARDRPGVEPIRLVPKQVTPLRVIVTNKGDEAANVRHVLLEGEALGLKFLTYDVTVNRRIPAGARKVITVPLDLYNLDNQATGYLPAAVRLSNGRHQVIAEQKFVVDIRGKATSTLGIFAIVMLVLAVASVGGLIYETCRRQLSRNRAVRGLQFMVAGAAVGLTLALGLPILRLTPIQPDAWIPLAIGPMAIGFVIGYLAPGPLSLSIEEAREDEILDLYATQALERISAEQTAAEQVARRSGETVVSGASAAAAAAAVAAHAHAPATTVVPGERSSGPAPATTVVPGERSSGPAPATTVVPGERSSGPAPATTAAPSQRPSGPAPATTAAPSQRPSGPAPATTAAPSQRPSGPAPATTAAPSQKPSPEPEAEDAPAIDYTPPSDEAAEDH